MPHQGLMYELYTGEPHWKVARFRGAPVIAMRATLDLSAAPARARLQTDSAGKKMAAAKAAAANWAGLIGKELAQILRQVSDILYVRQAIFTALGLRDFVHAIVCDASKCPILHDITQTIISG